MNERDLNTLIGRRLRMIRLLRGVSQQALADHLGITFQQVQKYERGRNNIAASRLPRIAAVLRVPVESFYRGIEEGTAGAFAEMLERYEQLSPQFGARELLELNAAFAGIPDPDLRSVLIDLMEQAGAAPAAENAEAA